MCLGTLHEALFWPIYDLCFVFFFSFSAASKEGWGRHNRCSSSIRTTLRTWNGRGLILEDEDKRLAPQNKRFTCLKNTEETSHWRRVGRGERDAGPRPPRAEPWGRWRPRPRRLSLPPPLRLRHPQRGASGTGLSHSHHLRSRSPISLSSRKEKVLWGRARKAKAWPQRRSPADIFPGGCRGNGAARAARRARPLSDRISLVFTCQIP